MNRWYTSKVFLFVLGGACSLLGLAGLRPPVRAFIPFYPEVRWATRCILENPFCSFKEGYASRPQDEKLAQKRRRHLETQIFSSGCREDGTVLWMTPDGPYWLPKGADARFAATLVAEQGRDIYTYGEHGVKPGDVVLDCGANVGIFCRKALSKGAKLVVAIEPSPENVECLRRNLEREIAEGRVILDQRGVWNQDDKLFLEVRMIRNPGGDTIRDQPPPGSSGAWVSLTTVDKIVSERGLSRVDFIKMDIEGAEQKALLGARETMRRFKPRIAIGTEHGDIYANVKKLHEIVGSFKLDYRSGCGSCIARDWRGVIPVEIFFY